MCRNIKTLFNFEPPASEDEVQAAALQYVRKVSGFTKPSKANEAAFNATSRSHRKNYRCIAHIAGNQRSAERP